MSVGCAGQEPTLGGGFLSSGPLLLCRKPSLPPGPVPLRRAPGPSAPPLPCPPAQSRHVCVWQARCRCERGRVTGPACRRLAPGIYNPTSGLLGLPGPQGRQVGAGWSLLHPDPEALAGEVLLPGRGRGRRLAPYLCPSRNRENSTHQTPSVRAPGASPCLPQPLVPGEEGGSACPCPRGGAACHQVPPGISGVVALPTWLSAFRDRVCPGPRLVLGPGSAQPAPLHTHLPPTPTLRPQPSTQDAPQPPAWRGARQGSAPGLGPLWV